MSAHLRRVDDAMLAGSYRFVRIRTPSFVYGFARTIEIREIGRYAPRKIVAKPHDIAQYKRRQYRNNDRPNNPLDPRILRRYLRLAAHPQST
jgi:hypothetical protein